MSPPKPPAPPPSDNKVTELPSVHKPLFMSCRVTWRQQEDGWWMFTTDGRDFFSLGPVTARNLAKEIFYAPAKGKPDPVPEI